MAIQEVVEWDGDLWRFLLWNSLLKMQMYENHRRHVTSNFQ
jgi:hypothetical protein